MKKLVCSLALAAAATALLGCVAYVPASPPPSSHPVPPPPPAPPPMVGISFFYDSLDPYGDWMWMDPYGWVWAPNAVAPFWRPYTVGRWVWTDWGWTWVSSERWGWATYHYGRWVRAPHHGWVWIPGDVWGPAWVAWRHGPGVVGWAPLPPEVRFHVGVGLEWGSLDFDVAIRLDNWCFVDDTRFVDNDVYRHAYPVGRNTTVIRGTKNATRVRVANGKIIDDGPDRGEIERRTNRPIPVRRLVDRPDQGPRDAEVANDELRVYRPGVRAGQNDVAPPRGRKPAAPLPPPADRKIENDADKRWDSGWNKDWNRLEKLQQRGAPPAPAPPAKPKPESLEQVRDENMDAAENAYRELVAERERAKRQADRDEKKKAQPKKDEKGGEKKN